MSVNTFFIYTESYNESPVVTLNCPNMTNRLYSVPDYNWAFKTELQDRYHICVFSGGNVNSSFTERDGQGKPTPELIEAASSTYWKIPDVDDTPTDHTIYINNGTKLVYRHVKLNATTNRFYIKDVYFLNGGEYVKGNNPYNSMYGYVDYNSVDIKELHFSVFHCDNFGYRDYDGWAGNYRSSYVFFVRGVMVGSVTDPLFCAGLEDNIITFSDGDDSAPNKPNKTTNRGGMGIGDYPRRADGERINVAIRNAATTYGGNGRGLTYYQMTTSALHAVLNKVFQIGIARDNKYLRECLVSAYILPIVDISHESANGVSVANERVDVGAVALFTLAHITNTKTATYTFTNNEDYSVGWGNYTDFTNTKLTLYLPFYGSVNIDVNACQYSQLKVCYNIDVYNGNIVYWVYTKSVDSDTDMLYGTYSGNCAIQIPLYGVGESGTILGKVTNTVSALATGALAATTGNPRMIARAVDASLNAATDMIPQYDIDRSGSIDINSTALQGWEIRLKISKPRVLREDSVYLIGLPSYYRATIGELPAGYHQVGAIELDSLTTATAGEKEALKKILERGFWK